MEIADITVANDVSRPLSFTAQAFSTQKVDLSGVSLERPSWEETSVRFLLIKRGQAEEVGDHPKIAPLLEEGWRIESIQPRVIEEGSRLLVLLHRHSRSSAS